MSLERVMKKSLIVVIILGLFGLCAVGTITIVALNTSSPPPAIVVPTPTFEAPSQSGPLTKRPSTEPAGTAQKAATAIQGNDLVHVGEDVPAGTYRVDRALEGGETCYWKKTKDAEGEDIIANDIPSGGRPQVTLKKGEWFSSSDCPTWVKK